MDKEQFLNEHQKMLLGTIEPLESWVEFYAMLNELCLDSIAYELHKLAEETPITRTLMSLLGVYLYARITPPMQEDFTIMKIRMEGRLEAAKNAVSKLSEDEIMERNRTIKERRDKEKEELSQTLYYLNKFGRTLQ